MEENQKFKTEYRNPKSRIFNKIIFNDSNNNNHPHLIKTKTLNLHYENSNSSRNIKKILDRKSLSSANFIKVHNIDTFKYYNNSSAKVTQSTNIDNNTLKLYSSINISKLTDKNNVLYKDLKIGVLHKKYIRRPRNINLSLYRNITTNYLNQKESNKIPILYPFYSSFNKTFESKSQKERYIKNFEKLVKVKTHIAANKSYNYKIISEFMLKNGIHETKYLNAKNLQKVENYIKNKINFNPDLTMTQIIKNIINDKSIKTSRNKSPKINILKSSNNQEKTKFEKSNIKKKFEPKYVAYKDNKNQIKNLQKSCSSPYLDLFSHQNEERLNKYFRRTGFFSDKNNLNIIVDNLEKELKKIKLDKINKLDENNKYKEKHMLLIKSLEDNNKYIPNLCLSSEGFSERYKYKITKFNNKIQNIILKNEYIKRINKRMYYDSKKNKTLKEFNLADIKKNKKLTELVFLNRGRQELLNRQIRKIDIAENLKKSFLFFKFK